MTAQSEKTPPAITSEEDAPLNSLQETDELSKEKNAINQMDKLKFSLGSSTLGWCLALMMLCVVLSLGWPDNTLVQNAFEAFKLIVMTILGYIFGSKTTTSS